MRSTWREARAFAGDRVTLVGNVTPANLLKNTPDEIDAEAKIICEKAIGNPRGFILGSGCEVPINTPPQNVDALINAARRYGQLSTDDTDESQGENHVADRPVILSISSEEGLDMGREKHHLFRAPCWSAVFWEPARPPLSWSSSKAPVVGRRSW